MDCVRVPLYVCGWRHNTVPGSAIVQFQESARKIKLSRNSQAFVTSKVTHIQQPVIRNCELWIPITLFSQSSRSKALAACFVTNMIRQLSMQLRWLKSTISLNRKSSWLTTFSTNRATSRKRFVFLQGPKDLLDYVHMSLILTYIFKEKIGIFTNNL